ncbi:hypothetical protein MCOR05_011455 [Pyricularia oryzae]|nr:hypothetical protein MCOR05_011455 [Pyricularia oryzae]
MSYEDHFPFHQSEVNTDADKSIYDSRDVLFAESFPELQTALRTRIHSLAVEFLDVGNDYKPHVVFMLVFKEKILNDNIAAARLSIENSLGIGTGNCQIKLLSYNTRTERSTGFTFNFKPDPSSTRGRRIQPTLLDFVHVINGQHSDLPLQFSGSDLTAFNFVEVSGQPLGRSIDLWDGCRDWISQAFVRFYYLGWIEWELGGILGKTDSFGPGGSVRTHYEVFKRTDDNQPKIKWKSAAFHDVIGLYFTPTAPTARSSSSRGGGSQAQHVYYNALPMEQGTFLQPSAAEGRMLAVERADGVWFHLPYAAVW